MPYVPIRIPPGMQLNTTEYDAKGSWVAGNWVRFWRGKVRPVGGWESVSTSAGLVVLEGMARSLLPWRDLEEARHIAIGTNTNLYVYDGSNIADITPVTDPIPAGSVSGGAGSGFGGSDFGTDNYGEARAFNSLTIAPAAWTMDNWGSEWVGCPNWYGNIYKWAPGDIEATLIEALTGTEVPQDNRAVLVTNERHMVAIGAGVYTGAVWEKNQRRIAWSDQEDYTAWTPTITNGAGDLDLQTSGLAICGAKFRTDILIWTEVDVHRMSYLGPPYYYGINRLADSAGIVSVGAYVVTNRFAFWVSADSFMIYDGTVKELAPEISEWYRDRLNPQQVGKTIAGHNPRFNEIWVYLVGRDATEISEYLIWNYEENTWAVGFLSRTAWDEAVIFGSPMACQPIGTEVAPQCKLMVHESGYLDDGQTRNGTVYIESSPIEIATGEQLLVVNRFIQDSSSGSTPPSVALTVSFTHRLAPEADELVEGPYVVDTQRGYTDVRFTARQAKIRWDQAVDENWSIGDYRLEVKQGSGR